MTILRKEFEKLVTRQGVEKNTFPVIKLPKIKNHKLGIVENNLPIFFILCDDIKAKKSINIDLELIRVEFSRECELTTEQGKSINGFYTLISLKSNSYDIQNYFLEIVSLMLSNLPVRLTMNVLKEEVTKLVSLFSRLIEPPIKTIQGLWAELLVIEQSSNPEYLISAWHFSPTDKFDFNDGENKIEIKSTSKDRRIHTFSITQLNPNNNSSLLIGSVFSVQTGVGESIFDLSDKIIKKVEDTELIFSLKEKIVSSLGSDFEKAHEIYFDYQLAIDSIAFYLSINIPKIPVAAIPNEITNVHFDCDLSNVSSERKSSVKTKLHKSVF